MKGAINKEIVNPEARVIITLTELFRLKNIGLSKLKFSCTSLAHMAFIVHNFEPMIADLNIKFSGEHAPEIKSLESFHLWLSQQGTWSDSNEFSYIPEVKKKISKRKRNSLIKH